MREAQSRVCPIGHKLVHAFRGMLNEQQLREKLPLSCGSATCLSRKSHEGSHGIGKAHRPE